MSIRLSARFPASFVTLAKTALRAARPSWDSLGLSTAERISRAWGEVFPCLFHRPAQPSRFSSSGELHASPEERCFAVAVREVLGRSVKMSMRGMKARQRERKVGAR